MNGTVPAARLEHVRFSYDNGVTWVLDGIDLTIRSGERLCLVGPNGSGKSTLARLIAGLAAPDGGDMTLLGHHVFDGETASANPSEYRDARHGIGTVFQNPEDQIVTTIVEDDVAFGPENLGVARDDIGGRIDESLQSVDMAGFRHADPTRMSGGQAKIEKECEAAEEIVAVSVSKFTKRFPNIQVTVEVPDEVLMVPMDATLIRQVIMNLLENAAIHGGNVTQIRVCLSREGTNACFSVSDNGVGIPKEKLTTIFNGGLSSVSHNNFDMKKNMGIGLSVCYTIVKAHDGTMTAENLDSGGACFRFYLPLEEGINSEIEG